MSLIMDALNQMKKQEAVPASDEIKKFEEAGVWVGNVAISEKILHSEDLTEPRLVSFSKPWSFQGILWAMLLIGGMGLISFKIVSNWGIESQVQQQAAVQTSVPLPQSRSSPSWDQKVLALFDHSAQWKQLTLEGIVYNSEQPACLINGKIYHTGDIWEGHEVISINRKEVTIKTPRGDFIQLMA